VDSRNARKELQESRDTLTSVIQALGKNDEEAETVLQNLCQSCEAALQLVGCTKDWNWTEAAAPAEDAKQDA